MVHEISLEHQEQIANTVQLSFEQGRKMQLELEGKGFVLKGAVTTINRDPSFVIEEFSYSSTWRATGEIAIGPHCMELPDGSRVRQVGLWCREQHPGEPLDGTIDKTT